MSFRRNIRNGFRRRYSAQERYLLDYANSTLTRASEAAFTDPRLGWAFADTGAGAWKSTNVPRIFGDGSILIEGARTNLVPDSADLSAWTNVGAVLTPGQTAPDGSTSAYLVEDNSAATFERLDRLLTVTATGASRHTTFIPKDSDESRFPEIQVANGTGSITGGLVAVQINTATGASAVRSGTATVAVIDEGTHWRVVIGFTMTSAGTVTTAVFPAVTNVIGTTNVVGIGETGFWGVQVEAGAFPSSPIRTSGAAATRAVDLCSFADGTVLDSGRWAVRVWPEHSASDLAANVVAAIFARNGSQNALWLRDQGGAKRLVLAVNNLAAVSQTVDWTAGSPIDITVDWNARELTVSGLASGDGAYAIIGADTWAAAAATTLYVGSYSAAGISPFFGVIGRPRAA